MSKASTLIIEGVWLDLVNNRLSKLSAGTVPVLPHPVVL